MSTQATLIERAKQGDHECFAELIEPYTNRAFRVALVLVDNEADASDIVQGASLRALQSIRSLRDLGAFEAWFLRIVGNLCRDLLRQRRRHR